ncbi:unnamed protein product [Didymodactylos carnosus]|nr:unnamed protein product [Didymodactylos carnosus]CAF4162313.1 unnamed protein product [Didymodactylos carnosus]CAF4363569.1 unnamed protein product [Didymodactylos carnosus]
MIEKSPEETVVYTTTTTVDSIAANSIITASTYVAEISYDRTKLIVLKQSALNLKIALEQSDVLAYNEETDSRRKSTIADHFTLRKLLAKLDISDEAMISVQMNNRP